MERDRRTQNPPSGSVTEVITRDIVPGREHEFERWAHRLVSATARYGATDTIITPDAATPARRVFVLHFANEEALGAWEASQERDRLVQEARKFSTPDVQRATGLETWFVLPGQRAIVPPPRWKMLLVTLIGAYPLGASLCLRPAIVGGVAAAGASRGGSCGASEPDDLLGHAPADAAPTRLALPPPEARRYEVA
jgi:antibiotic biosynthesis monooxygenase (ABM) superfamily enzyme